MNAADATSPAPATGARRKRVLGLGMPGSFGLLVVVAWLLVALVAFATRPEKVSPSIPPFLRGEF